MKKIERKVNALIAAALSGVITMLGFSGCKSHKKINSPEVTPVGIEHPIIVMYGVPANVYKLQGVVKGPDGKPVGAATIVVSDGSGQEVESVKTNPDGTYFTKYMRLPGDLKVVVRPDDESLAPDSTIVSSKKLMSDRRTDVNFKLKNRK